jgi:hypothetical protein
MPKYYTGIGSRETPKNVLTMMQRIARYLAQNEWTLRSGAAPGADTAFETGCVERTLEAKEFLSGKDPLMEIYLPWIGFGNRRAHHPGYYFMKVNNPGMNGKAGVIAAKHHPAPERLNPAGMALHTRNVFQVLGQDLATPSSFVVCYTGEQGGTNQALRIAEPLNIPIFNLKKPDALNELKKFLGMPIVGYCPFQDAEVILV